MKILCPFHEEKTPSLHIYEDGFQCFGCGAKGPLDKLPAEYKPERIPPKYVENVQRTVEWIETLPTRNIRGLNFHCSSEHYYLIWPSKLYYLRRRFEDVPGIPKYLGPAGHPRPLYVPGFGVSKTLIVIEGEINAASVALACPDVNVASPGSAGEFYSKSGEKNLAYYNLFDRIFLIVDKDPAGAKAAIELKSKLLQLNKEVHINLWEQDANDILMSYGKERLKDEINKTLGMS